MEKYDGLTPDEIRKLLRLNEALLKWALEVMKILESKHWQEHYQLILDLDACAFQLN